MAAAHDKKEPRSTLKQQAILRAATQLFLRLGYSYTSMDAIAQKARVTKQTVYAYYHDKDTLFVQMISELCRAKAPRALPEEERLFKDILFDVGLEFLDLLTSPDVLAATRVVIAESERHPALAQLYYDSGTQKVVSMLAHWFDRQNREGRAAIPNTSSAASYFLSILKGQYFLRMILRAHPIPSLKAKKDHVRESVRIFMRLYTEDTPLVTHSIL